MSPHQSQLGDTTSFPTTTIEPAGTSTQVRVDSRAVSNVDRSNVLICALLLTVSHHWLRQNADKGISGGCVADDFCRDTWCQHHRDDAAILVPNVDFGASFELDARAGSLGMSKTFHSDGAERASLDVAFGDPYQVALDLRVIQRHISGGREIDGLTVMNELSLHGLWSP